jgi:carbon storage regulator CsrA
MSDSGFLIIRRRPGERFMIGDDITIMVNEIKGNQISFAIVAPKTTRIIRPDSEEDRQDRERYRLRVYGPQDGEYQQ